MDQLSTGSLHYTDDELELYSLGRLTEERTAMLEEHLLLCVSCQDRLDHAETFALAMRHAIKSEPAGPIRENWRAWFRLPAIRAVAGFAMAVLIAGFYWNSIGEKPGTVISTSLASLQLTATRGESPAIRPAGETELTLTDAPAGLELHAEVVNSSGAAVWNGTPSSEGGIRLQKSLPPGDYFVRLYGQGGKLLHEYGFRVVSSTESLHH